MPVTRVTQIKKPVRLKLKIIRKNLFTNNSYSLISGVYLKSSFNIDLVGLKNLSLCSSTIADAIDLIIEIHKRSFFFWRSYLCSEDFAAMSVKKIDSQRSLFYG